MILSFARPNSDDHSAPPSEIKLLRFRGLLFFRYFEPIVAPVAPGPSRHIIEEELGGTALATAAIALLFRDDPNSETGTGTGSRCPCNGFRLRDIYGIAEGGTGGRALGVACACSIGFSVCENEFHCGYAQ